MILTRLRLWLRTVMQRRRLDREMQDEMRSHLERSAVRLMERGLSREEAVRQAHREFGPVEYIQEQARDARGARWVETTIADLRFGLRHFGRTPLSTVTMVLVLVLGIGANTALFTVVHSLLTQPPPGIARAESMVRIRGLNRDSETGRIRNRRLSYPEVRDYAARSGLFRDVAAFANAEVVLDPAGAEASVQAANATFVTDNYFRVVGVTPVVGAGLPADLPVDAPAPPMVAVIGHSLWDRHYSRSPAVVGKTIKVNDVAVTIVGVAPARFGGTSGVDDPKSQLWLPLATLEVMGSHSVRALHSYDSMFLSAVAHLQPGVTIDQALPTAQSVAGRSAQLMTDRNPNAQPTADVVPVRIDNEFKPTDNEQVLVFAMFGGITLLILLITCTNVSALLVGLAVARRREIAVRLSLGAPRARLIRQLVTESVLLAVTAGTLALLVMWILVRTFSERLVELEIELNWAAFAFTLGFALATGILFGLSPALHATRLAVGDVLKDSASTVAATRSRLQRALVVGQIALTQPLLVGLGALILIVMASGHRRPESALNERILSIHFAGAGGSAQRRDVMRQLQERIGALPGVVGAVPQSSAVISELLTVHPSDRVVGIEYTNVQMTADLVQAGYFALFEISFVRGRDFNMGERDAANAALLNQKQDRTMVTQTAIIIASDGARRLWGPADPIGRRLIGVDSRRSSSYVVVGVVAEAKPGASDDGSSIRAFLPYSVMPRGLYVRTRGPAEPLIPLIRSVAANEAPLMPITSMRTLAAMADQGRRTRLQASAAAASGGLLALFLSAIGIYAVVAFAVGQRTREIGVRTALGAERRQLVGLFFFQGLRMSLVGLAIGLPFGLMATRTFMVWQDIPSISPLLLATLIASVVVSVAALATWIPARRAASVDPLTALRLD